MFLFFICIIGSIDSLILRLQLIRINTIIVQSVNTPISNMAKSMPIVEIVSLMLFKIFFIFSPLHLATYTIKIATKKPTTTPNENIVTLSIVSPFQID